MNVKMILDAKGSGEVFTMHEETTIKDFVKEACDRNIGAMLVTNADHELVGIVTERDVLHQANQPGDFKRSMLCDIMTRDIAFVQAEDDIKTAMDYMVTLKIRHLPVLSGTDIAGLITIRDLILAMRKADDEETRLLVEYLHNSLKDKDAENGK